MHALHALQHSLLCPPCHLPCSPLARHPPSVFPCAVLQSPPPFQPHASTLSPAPRASARSIRSCTGCDGAGRNLTVRPAASSLRSSGHAPCAGSVTAGSAVSRSCAA
eukprot:176320-Chlamydomonas_euryale.AAC.1